MVDLYIMHRGFSSHGIHTYWVLGELTSTHAMVRGRDLCASANKSLTSDLGMLGDEGIVSDRVLQVLQHRDGKLTLNPLIY